MEAVVTLRFSGERGPAGLRSLADWMEDNPGFAVPTTLAAPAEGQAVTGADPSVPTVTSPYGERLLWGYDTDGDSAAAANVLSHLYDVAKFVLALRDGDEVDEVTLAAQLDTTPAHLVSWNRLVGKQTWKYGGHRLSPIKSQKKNGARVYWMRPGAVPAFAG